MMRLLSVIKQKKKKKKVFWGPLSAEAKIATYTGESKLPSGHLEVGKVQSKEGEIAILGLC